MSSSAEDFTSGLSQVGSRTGTPVYVNLRRFRVDFKMAPWHRFIIYSKHHTCLVGKHPCSLMSLVNEAAAQLPRGACESRDGRFV